MKPSDNPTEIICGIHAVQSLLRHEAAHIDCLYYDNNRRDARLQKILQIARDNHIPCQTKSRKVLTELATNEHHQGVAIAYRPSQDTPPLKTVLDATENPLLLVLDAITDPHNLGACLRTADAAGVTAVIYPKDKSAGITATVRKIACGAAETVPAYPVTNLARTLDELKADGIWVVGAAGDARQTFYQMDLAGPLALVMGAEGKGLRRLTREKCDFLANLPMLGTVSSLNVSVATGVCLYEIIRQRQ